jgi:dipeptidase
MYGAMGIEPAGKHPPGTTRKIYDWESGKFLGEIEEATETYNVVGPYLNEYGVAIGETTFEGNKTLWGDGHGIMDYGNLIFVTLQRAKTAREAIKLFDELTAKYGYASHGESFTIGDKNEVWILELIGKGNYEKGAVWVAVRVPDGHVSGHANQARIQQFPFDDPGNCMYSKDVVDFAIKIGLWDAKWLRQDFSFSDVYDPITLETPRHTDARVWAFFSAVAEDANFEARYEKYAFGRNLSAKARMPLSIKPKAKLSAFDVMSHHRNHYEGTILDGRFDVGAGGSGTPFRVRPMVWEYGNETYVNERPVGTPMTSFVWVAQLRSGLPASLGGLLWFGVDDATFTSFVPFHGGTTRVPKQFSDSDGHGILSYSTDSAYWAFNTVANFVYDRWFLANAVIQRCAAKQVSLGKQLQDAEAKALAIYDKEPERAMELLTAASEKMSEQLVREEFALFGELMVKHRDGFKISSTGPDAPSHGGPAGGVIPKVEQVGYSNKRWYKTIVDNTGDHYKMTSSAGVRALERGISGTVSASMAADSFMV